LGDSVLVLWVDVVAVCDRYVGGKLGVVYVCAWGGGLKDRECVCEHVRG
jgi:hypothetical protein